MASSPNNDVRTMKVAWNKRDLLLFANSIGVEADDLHFLYELHPKFQAIPSYPIVLSQKGETEEVVDFFAAFDKNQLPARPGLPKLDAKRMVDAGRAMTFYRPIPTTSAGRSFALKLRTTGVYDKGKAGTVVVTETELVDTVTGDAYVKVVGNSFYIGQGNWGGPKGPKSPSYATPDCQPDCIYTIETTKETPLLYRLNGDTNPLHATPEPGIAMGFEGNIVHGLYTYNATFYFVLRATGKSDPTRIKHFECRFASPVRPGDHLTINIWKTGKMDKEDLEEVRFNVKGRGNKEVLTNGRALVKPADPKANL